MPIGTNIGRGNVLAGLCPKGICAKKIRLAQQKSGLKPPLPGVDSPILANFLLWMADEFFQGCMRLNLK